MNDDPSTAPDDERTDRLLARRYRDTSLEFEARWTALKRDLRQSPPARSWPRPTWHVLAWIGALGAAAVLVMVVVSSPPDTPPASAPELSPQLTELFAMETVLERASPLLDADNRTALLHLPETTAANGNRL